MSSWELTARVKYHINAEDLLVDVSADWTRFALENAAPHLSCKPNPRQVALGIRL